MLDDERPQNLQQKRPSRCTERSALPSCYLAPWDFALLSPKYFMVAQSDLPVFRLLLCLADNSNLRNMYGLIEEPSVVAMPGTVHHSQLFVVAVSTIAEVQTAWGTSATNPQIPRRAEGQCVCSVRAVRVRKENARYRVHQRVQ